MNENKTFAAENSYTNSSVTLRMILFVIAAVVAVACMFMNWLPVELNLGMVQLEEVFGRVNVFTLSKTLFRVEEALGMLAAYLPEEFGTYKFWSVLLVICAVVTIAFYVCGVVLNILKKGKVADIIAGAASVCAVITSLGFCMLVTDFYKKIGESAVSQDALAVVLKSPCMVVLVCGVVSGICALPQGTVGDAISACIGWCVAAVQNVVWYISEVFAVVVENIGYLISDILGGIAGVFAGMWIASATGTNILGAISGLAIAALTAVVCCALVCRITGRSDEMKVAFRAK